MIAADLAGLAEPVGSLELLPGNPRRGDVDAVARSLERFGQRKPIVARRSDRVVVAGNHTLQAARKLGWADVAVVWVDDDEATAQAFALADNRTAELGDYHHEALVAMVSAVGSVDMELLEAAGYSAEDLAALLGEAEQLPAALNDPDDAPEPPADPVSVLGDVWLLGPHRVLCGDSTDVVAVEAMMGGDRADCMWTDPPYGVAIVGGSHALSPAERKARGGKTIENDSGVEVLPELLAGAFAVATAALKPGAPWYIAHPDTFRNVFEQAVRDAGWLFRQNLIWVKNTLVLGRSDYHYRHEPILYGFTVGGEGRLGRGGDRWYGDDAQTTVFDVDRPARNGEHPTMKPVELIVRMLNNSCPPGGLVYEPFGGSGSTLIAAHQTGRVARVVELDPRYVDVICRRYQEHTGARPVLQATGEPMDFTA